MNVSKIFDTESMLFGWGLFFLMSFVWIYVVVYFIFPEDLISTQIREYLWVVLPYVLIMFVVIFIGSTHSFIDFTNNLTTGISKRKK